VAIKLGELLISRALISRQQLDDALLAQRQFGGRLGTNLVEMGAIGDDQLAACLSQQLGVPWVRPQTLASIPREVIAKLPKELAEQFRAVPIKNDLHLHLCMSDPQNFDRIEEISFAANLPIKPYVVTETTLNYALERYYGIRREVRLLQAALWGSTERFSGSTQLPDRLAEGPVVSTPPPVPAAAGGQPAGVIEELSRVMSGDDMVKVLLRYFADLFANLIVVSLNQGRAAPVAAIQGSKRVTVPVGSSVAVARGSLLEAMVAQRRILHRPQLNDGDLAALCAAVGIPAVHITAVPVLEGQHCPYIVLGQGRDEKYMRDVLGGLQSFLSKAAHALRIIALRDQIIRAV